MNALAPLLLLLAASAANAVEPVASQTALRMGHGPLTAIGDAPPSRKGQVDEVLVFDSHTGAQQYLSVLSSPRTFMGMAFDLETDVGPDPLISRIVVYLIYNGTTTQTFAGLRARVQLWDVWSGNAQPVFAAPQTLAERTFSNVTVQQNTFYSLTLMPDPPIPLSGLTSHGIAMNFQGDTGAGFENIDTLTSLISVGTMPLALGSNPLTGNVGYINKDGQTDFNFLPPHGFSVGWATEALALKLYAIDTLIDQQISDILSTPANPRFTDDSFSVSATGGTSGQPVTFSVDASSAAVCMAGGTHGATITILDQGACRVHADQAGNATHRAAPRRSLTVLVSVGSLVQDGGFEAGAETPWVQGSTNFGTPLCDAGCNSGETVPFEGELWAWFGGVTNAYEASFVEQTGVIAAGSEWLDFQLWWKSPVFTPPDPDATFKVLIDGNTMLSLKPLTAAVVPYSTGYTQASIDISAFADGNTHTLRLEAISAAAATSTNIYVDDIRIRAVAGPFFLDGFESQ